jgi:hypothetical protein
VAPPAIFGALCGVGADIDPPFQANRSADAPALVARLAKQRKLQRFQLAPFASVFAPP